VSRMDVQVEAATGPDDPDAVTTEIVESSEDARVRRRRADWDGAWKQLVTCFPAQVLGQVCGLDVAGLEIIALPTEMHRPMFPDLVFRMKDPSGQGADRLVHLEVQAQSESGFELRVATYFVLLANRHKMVPHQVVIMPAGGPFTGRYSLGPLSLDYQVVDVTTLPSDELLAGPLAPLALWSMEHHDDPAWPARVVEIVVDRIRELPDRDLQVLLAQLVILKGEDATSLLAEALDRRTMSNVLENTAVGQRLREEGREEGREEALAGGLLVMLQERFGEVSGLKQVAERLAATGDFRVGLERIRAAASLEDLLP
jgi:predicted transposase YdaD